MAPSSTIPVTLLRWQTLHFPLNSWEQSYPSFQPPVQHSHLSWCWPHGCCSPRAAGRRQCSRGQHAPPSPCASSSSSPEQGCCLQTPGAHWTVYVGTLQTAQMGGVREQLRCCSPYSNSPPKVLYKHCREHSLAWRTAHPSGTSCTQSWFCNTANRSTRVAKRPGRGAGWEARPGFPWDSFCDKAHTGVTCLA